MPELEFRDGRYYLKPGGLRMNRYIILAPLVALVIAMGVSLSAAGGFDKGGPFEDAAPMAMIIPFVFMGIFVAISAATLSARQGVIVIDPQASTVTFTRMAAGRYPGRRSVSYSEIREVVLTARSGVHEGRGPGKLFVIRLMTEGGEEDLLSLPAEAEARRLAQEISGLVARSLRDMT